MCEPFVDAIGFPIKTIIAHDALIAADPENTISIFLYTFDVKAACLIKGLPPPWFIEAKTDLGGIAARCLKTEPGQQSEENDLKNQGR